MKVKVSWGRYVLKMSQFLTRGNPALCKLGTEKIFQAIRAFLAVQRYALKHCLVQELLFTSFAKKISPVGLLTDARVLQLVLDNSQSKAYVPNEMSLPKAFQAKLCFHAVALTSGEVRRKKAEHRLKRDE